MFEPKYHFTYRAKNGVRDPHILRGPYGKFYMVATDMQASQGWSSNHGIVLMRQYKYVFFFSGNPTAGGGKVSGYAVADDPAG